MRAYRVLALIAAGVPGGAGLAGCSGGDDEAGAPPAAGGPIAVNATDTACEVAATDSYQRYVKSQTAALLEKTQEFVDAVKAGDVAKFTGFHRIEKDLWVTGNVAASGQMADRLMADIREIVTKANAEQLFPLNLTNGAKELLDEVATGKITGEEDRYSHADLWDFAANLDGSRGAVAALRPVLEERAPDLVKTLDEKFAAAESTLEKHREGGGWKLHTELSQAELKELSDSINALAEPVSKVAAVVAK
jgi:iron uptake system component EfeO